MRALSKLPSTFVAAGPFGPWLEQTRAALRGAAGVDVPCGDCVGCCVSSYPIPLRAADSRAIAEVPLQFFARTPKGQAVMVAREDGTCPMFNAGECSIYGDRPQTCRDYDCRVFAAAGIEAGGYEREVINRRVREWRFSYSTDAERAAHTAVRAAAAFIRDKADCFPERVPVVPTGIAVLAIKVYTVFLARDIDKQSEHAIAAAVVRGSSEFEVGPDVMR